jgi:thiamine-phosphate pyrophosphorylase
LDEVAREAAEAGLDDLQIREKDLPGRALGALARDLLAAVRGTAVRVLVNGRPDIAQTAGAHGVQLPEEGLPIADVKRSFPALAVGASRHSIDGARQAEAEGADFVVLGPVFATPGKPSPALGLDVLAEAARAVAIPIYAIGGVDAANARRVAEAGARGLALMRPFLTGAAAETVAGIRAALRL